MTAGYDRHPAVHHLSLEVFSGDMVAVVGPNGSGKTTLLRLLARDLKAMSGEVRLPPAAHCRVAYLPQLNRTDRSFPITVHDYVASGLWHETGALGGLGASQRQRVMDALHAVGLDACARRLIDSLSGGEFQRVRFAQLMLQDARLVLLDEPFAGIDATTLGVLLPLLEQWNAAGITIVTVLHELDVVRRWFPKTLLLARHLIAFGETARVLTDANWQRAAGLSPAVWEAATWCRQDSVTGPSGVDGVGTGSTGDDAARRDRAGHLG
ncbi:MAG TPA: ABC transporter ATP-binding protein [Lautropia sp.]|nr:ABC transporter ATP-binding protein [Lautropia sp.]